MYDNSFAHYVHNRSQVESVDTTKMVLLRYLKPTDGLPDPNGSPSSSIQPHKTFVTQNFPDLQYPETAHVI